jgi:hypothetical protein
MTTPPLYDVFRLTNELDGIECGRWEFRRNLTAALTSRWNLTRSPLPPRRTLALAATYTACPGLLASSWPRRRTALPAVPSWPRRSIDLSGARPATSLSAQPHVVILPAMEVVRYGVVNARTAEKIEAERWKIDTRRETSVDICYPFLPWSPCHCIELHHSSIVYYLK